MTHGTLSTYNKHSCRCFECRAAKATYQNAYRERRRADAAADKITIEHGTANSYHNYGCRCDYCRLAATTDRRRYRRNPKSAPAS